MNLISARAMLPINDRLDRRPRVAYLPRIPLRRWWLKKAPR